MTPEQIAAKLTKAQRRYVLAMPIDGSFLDWKATGMKQRRSRMAMTNGGITAPYRQGPVTEFGFIRLSSLGLAVRAVLERQPTLIVGQSYSPGDTVNDPTHGPLRCVGTVSERQP